MTPPLLRRVGRLLRELKRRKVYQVTAVYVVLAVGVLEILDLLVPTTTLPSWASPLVLSLAIAGLPIVLVMAWTFDVTPTGVVRTTDDVREAIEEGRPSLPEADHTNPPAGQDAEDEPAPEPGSSTGPASPTGAAKSVGRAASAGPTSSTTGELNPLAVAVLPFDNLSGSSDAEPFAVGLHDDLLTELSRASALTVISRTSVRGYRGTDKSMREIARELGAGTIVEGGVQKAGDRVRLNVQLIDARTDAHRWAERYDRELTAETIFDLQSELASKIMAALEAQLTAAEKARSHERPTDDLEAYRLYHLGRETFVDRSRTGIEDAAEYFEAAIERDPAYAHAWAGLGMALVALVDYGHVEAEEIVQRGKAASLKAVELDPELPEAHAAMGNYYGYVHDGPAARDALTRAIHLGPGLALGHQWASWVDLCMGDPESALTAAGRATRLDPLEPEARGNLALAHLGLGDAEASRAEALRILESHSTFSYGRWVAGMAEHLLGRPDEAVGQLSHIREPQFTAWAPLSRGLLDVASGRESEARVVLEGLEREGAPFKAAVLAAALGEEERFFALLDAARPLFWDDALALRYWRIAPLERFHDDDRFQDHLRALDRRWGVRG